MLRTPLTIRFAALLAAVVWNQTVQARPATDVAQARYVTFFLLSGNSSGDPSLDRQLQAEIERALNNKEVVLAAPEEAQAVAVVNVATAARHSREDFYTGWGGWEWRPSVAATHAGLQDYKAGSLVVDVFDARSKQLIWTGEAPNVGTAGSSERRKNALDKMFRSFPVPGFDSFVPLSPAGTNHAAIDDSALRIIFSTGPSMLVHIDGEPHYQQVSGTNLDRVVNADAFLVRDETGTHYLKLGDLWMEADGLTSSWSAAGMLPTDARKAFGDSAASVDQLSPPFDDAVAPTVYVVTMPTELIVTEGAPRYVPFKSTALSYLQNASAVVFREPTDHELYVRLSGGSWARAWTTRGHWERLDVTALPADLQPLKDISRGELTAASQRP